MTQHTINNKKIQNPQNMSVRIITDYKWKELVHNIKKNYTISIIYVKCKEEKNAAILVKLIIWFYLTL